MTARRRPANIRFSQAQWNALQIIAARERRTLSDVVRNLVDATARRRGLLPVEPAPFTAAPAEQQAA